MISDQIVVVGASGFGRETIDVLKAMQRNGATFEIAGVVDDKPSESNLTRLTLGNNKYLGTINSWLQGDSRNSYFILAVGNPLVRKGLVETIESKGHRPYTAVHPQAIVGSESKLCEGAVICAGAVISTNVQIGRHVHVNPNATIGHDAQIGDYSSINPGAIISGEVSIGKETLVGAGATVLQQLLIGDRSTVGASSLVTKNIPNDVVVKGVPGRWNKPKP